MYWNASNLQGAANAQSPKPRDDRANGAQKGQLSSLFPLSFLLVRHVVLLPRTFQGRGWCWIQKRGRGWSEEAGRHLTGPVSGPPVFAHASPPFLEQIFALQCSEVGRGGVNPFCG